MDGEIYGREGEGRMRNNNVSHLQIGACWKQQRGRLQDSRFKRVFVITTCHSQSSTLTNGSKQASIHVHLSQLLRSYLRQKTRVNQALAKRYGAPFTCMTTRAVHLELPRDLSTNCFVLCLRRFRALQSDNGTNFVGAEKELYEALKQISTRYRKKIRTVTLTPKIFGEKVRRILFHRNSEPAENLCF